MPQIAQGRVRFGCFELDPRAGELYGNGQRTVLQEQQLKVLLMLIEREGELATREEIKKKLWPSDTIVEFDSGINATIRKLRRCLGDSAENPKYIETIAHRGYRLMVPVEWVRAEDSSGEESSAEASSDASESGSASEPDSEAVPKARLKVGRLTGKIVSHYRVLEVIGGGGMGLVYRAEHLKLGRAVALKFLPEEVGDDPKARERFAREADAVYALDHPNICTVYDFDEYEGHPFIAMQLLQGKTLRDYIAEGRFRLTQPEGLEIAIQIASGLEAAHEKGIIHRDIKPANIFITEKNVAKILDFGVAKVIQLSEPTNAVILSDDRREESKDPYSNEKGRGFSRADPASLEEERGDQSPSGLIPALDQIKSPNGAPKGAPLQNSDAVGAPEGAPLQMPGLKPEEGDEAPQRWAEAQLYHPKEATLTRTGMKLGTAGYMSPEQVRGEPLDARSDIFSFGLVLYEMATGERAFTGETEAILHNAIQHREPRPVRELAPEISSAIGGVIGCCLEKEPPKRYQSATELKDALVHERVQVPPAAPESGPERRKEPHPRRQIAAALIAALVVVTLAAVFYRLSHPRFKLTDKDTIVLADFENKTGDPVFDGSLTWALRIALEQTPFLDVLSSEKVTRILTETGHDPEAPLTPDLVREVCIKTNSTAAVIGTIADAGNRYRIGLRAVRCDTGRVVAMAGKTANERSQIVAELGQAAVDLRGKLGEPSTTIQQFDKPLDHATSASVDTLKLYTEAIKRASHKGDTTGLADMLQVTESDPSFAIAYRALMSFYHNTGQRSASNDSLRKAFELRQQLTDRERLRIEGFYYMDITGEMEKAINVWQVISQKYPSDFAARNDLAWCFRAIGELEKAAVAAREAIHINPEVYAPYFNLMAAEIGMNRWAEAKAVYEEAHSRKVGSDLLSFQRFVVAFLERDRDGMKEELKWEKSDPSAIGDVFVDEAGTHLYSGRARLARTFLAQAVGKKLHAGFQESAAIDRCEFAMQEAEIGETVRAREDAIAALAMYPSSRELQICSSYVLARSGNGADAQRTATEIEREKPLGTIANGLQVPALRGAALLAEEKPAEAVKALDPSLPLFRGGTDALDGLTLAYMRGIALLELKRAPEAVVEFKKIIDHPGLARYSVIGPLAHLQLARAQVMMGDKDGARKSYQDFLTLWKDADPDIPIYRQAKAEYAKLNKLPATRSQRPAKSSQLSAKELGVGYQVSGFGKATGQQFPARH